MATTSDDDWIQGALARLDELEQRRDALEAAGGAGAELDALNAEIRELYAKLEAAAEEGDAAPAAAPSAAAVASTADDAEADPFGPGPGLLAPPGGPPEYVAPVDHMASGGLDDLPNPNRGRNIGLAVAALLIVGGGVGYWAYKNQPRPAAPAPSEPKEVMVVDAGPVPDDTQGPRGAVGADVDRTPERDLDAAARAARHRPGGGGGGGAPRSTARTPAPRGEGTRIKLDDSNDPLK